jgi:hypothetical protein
MNTMKRRLEKVELRYPRPVTTADILQSPAWQQIRRAVIDALEPYPDARIAVAEHLQAVLNGTDTD